DEYADAHHHSDANGDADAHRHAYTDGHQHLNEHAHFHQDFYSNRHIDGRTDTGRQPELRHHRHHHHVYRQRLPSGRDFGHAVRGGTSRVSPQHGLRSLHRERRQHRR